MIYDVVIVGGGMIGASAAWACHQRGMKVAVLEAKPMTAHVATPDLRVIALSYQSYRWLHQLGVASDFDAARTCQFNSMYLDDVSGDSHMILESSTLNRRFLGVIIDSQHIQATLQAKLKDHIDCFYSEKLLDLVKEPDAYTLVTDKQKLKTRVVIAADGANSSIKSHLDIYHDEHDYQQRAVVAYIHAEKQHANCAWQRFLPTGSLALLPCADGHTVSLVWTLPTTQAQELQALEHEAFNAQLQAAMGQRLGALNLASERATFPIRAQHVHAYGVAGVFLVGDAAHTIHPLAGLGANLGFSDVRALVEILSQTSKDYWADPRVLARYQRERLYTNAMVSQLMTVLNRTMTQTGPLSRLRAWGMSTFHRLPPLKALSILYTDYI